MINLLPQEIKHTILQERFLRFFVVLSSIVSLAVIAGMIPLFALWLELDGEARSLRDRQEILLKTPDLERAREIEDTLRGFNKTLAFFEENQKKSLPLLLIFEKIIANREGVRIDSFIYDFSGDKTLSPQFHISGTARDRDTLITFIDSLENDPNIENVSSPLSNLLQGKNTEFLITFTVVAQELK